METPKIYCLSIDCPERFSLCCRATCRASSEPERMLGVPPYFCSKCGKEFVGGECNVKERTLEEMASSYRCCDNGDLGEKHNCLKSPNKNNMEEMSKRFDELFNGMAPKVSNFGSFVNEDAKDALQNILTQWWGEADSFYREPLKKFLQKELSDQAKEIMEEMQKILPEEMTLGRENPFLKIMYDHAPNNAKFYETNVDRINNFREKVKDLITTYINNETKDK